MTERADLRRARARTARRFAAAFALLCLCAGQTACRSRTPEEHPNILFISLDTVRRDAVGPYRRGEPSITPHLDALARAGVVFDAAYAQMPFTLASHMSMFTGLQPEVHGVLEKTERLSPGITTLPQLLAAAGYATLGLVTNDWMKGDFGFDRGFDHYERIKYGLTYADRVNARLLELLDQPDLDHEIPTFLFLHYLDAHSDFSRVTQNSLPYYAPPPYLQESGIDEPSKEFCDSEDRCATDFLLAAMASGRTLPDETLVKLRRLYEDGIRGLDAEVGRLLAALDARGWLDDALIIVTSDHGEEFQEHGELLHSQPYHETLAVPLIMRFPRGRYAGTRVSSLVESIDLLPTIAAFIGLELQGPVQGRSVLPLLGGSGTLPPRPALGQHKTRKDRYALRDERWTLIHDVATGASELYDRQVDLDERIDVAAQHPERVRDMVAALVAQRETDQHLASDLRAEPSDSGSVLSEEEAERLRRIGYLN